MTVSQAATIAKSNAGQATPASSAAERWGALSEHSACTASMSEYSSRYGYHYGYHYGYSHGYSHGYSYTGSSPAGDTLTSCRVHFTQRKHAA